MADPVDQGDRRFPLRGRLPRPIPSRYRFLDAEERAGRGRLAVRMWVLGCSPTTAWGFAMAEGPCWREHRPDTNEGRLVDTVLPNEYMRRCLMDVVWASDLDREDARVLVGGHARR